MPELFSIKFYEFNSKTGGYYPNLYITGKQEGQNESEEVLCMEYGGDPLVVLA